MKRMAIISAGFVPVPAVDGGAGEVLTTEIINGNELAGDYFMDIYTIESPKLDEIKYKNAEIVQIHIGKILWFCCKARNAFLKLFKRKYRFIPYNQALIKKFRDNYDIILVENNMQVYEDIYKHVKNGKNNMIYHMHNDIDGTTKPEYLCKYISSTAKLVLPVSEYIKQRFCEVAPTNKIEVLYNCVDLELFCHNENASREELRKKFEIEPDEFVFLYAGRIDRGKGILELIRAFKKVRDKYKNVKLMIVGSKWYNITEKDEYFNLLVNESEECGKFIVFTGYVFPKEMPNMYMIADAMVIPSIIGEAFGVVALEGMAMGIPIISTNSGGLGEVLDTQKAIIIDKNSDLQNNLMEAMERIVTDRELRESIKKKAFEEVQTNKLYDKKEYYNNFKKIIDKYVD